MTGHGTAQHLQQVQARRLAALLDGARRHTRLHAQRLHGLAADAPLAALPVLAKDELMAQFDDGLADPALSLRLVQEFAADPELIGTPLLGRYTVWESSGSSGSPGLFVQDAAAMAVYDALEALRRPPRPDGHAQPPGPLAALAAFDPLGLFAAFDPARALRRLGLGERYAFVGALEGHFASYSAVQRLRRLNPWLGLNLRSFSILQPVPALVDALNQWQPTVLATYPTAAVMLAEQVDRGRLELQLVELLTGGETLDEAARSHVAQAFGCPVRNSYGASEFLAIASECAQGRLHVNADWVILEPVDRHFRPLPAGELSHTVLLTNLANHLQPLIRYDLGDRVCQHAQPCACGSPLPSIDVLGRDDDALQLPGADGQPVALLPLALATVLEVQAGVFDFQLRQRDARTLALRLGGGASAGAAAFERCHQVLQAFAQAQGVARLRLVDEPGAPITRGRSGKVQRVIGLPRAGGPRGRRGLRLVDGG